MESLLLSELKLPVTNRDMLAMLLLLTRISAVAELRTEYMDGARPLEDGGGGGAIVAWLTSGLVMVDRLLVRLGTSSTDTRTSGPGSPNTMGMFSLIEDVP